MLDISSCEDVLNSPVWWLKKPYNLKHNPFSEILQLLRSDITEQKQKAHTVQYKIKKGNFCISSNCECLPQFEMKNNL